MITRETEKDIVSDLRDFYINEIQEYFETFPTISKASDSLLLSYRPISDIQSWSLKRLQFYYYRITGKEITNCIIEGNGKKGPPKKYNLEEVCEEVKKYLDDGYPIMKIFEKIGFGSHRNMMKYLQRNGVSTKGFLVIQERGIEG